MYKHILTSETIELGTQLNLHKIPTIQSLLKEWGGNENIPKNQFEIFIFKLSDIIKWDPVEDKFFLNRLHYLLVHGQRNKQLVIIQIKDAQELEYFKGSLLYILLIYNTQAISFITRNKPN